MTSLCYFLNILQFQYHSPWGIGRKWSPSGEKGLFITIVNWHALVGKDLKPLYIRLCRKLHGALSMEVRIHYWSDTFVMIWGMEDGSASNRTFITFIHSQTVKFLAVRCGNTWVDRAGGPGAKDQVSLADLLSWTRPVLQSSPSHCLK